MPQMEKKYRVDAVRAHARGITGVSMGGFGALRLAFKYPATVRRSQRADAGVAG